MNRYKPQTPLAALSDRLLRVMVTCGAGISWFVILWGLSLPALTAGVALGGLIWLCARQFGKRMTAKKEHQMRRIIGGELALRQLLTLPPRHAAFQAALWITPRFPIEMHKALNWAVSGMLEGQSVWVRLIAQHDSVPINVQQLVECAREIREHRMERCILCLTAPASKEALEYAAEHEPPMLIVSRTELIDLAGLCAPATDDDLRRLGEKKQSRRSAQEWLAVILDASRARRYFWYGIGLSALALATGAKNYAVPAGICLLLYAGCKLYAISRRHWQARSTP